MNVPVPFKSLLILLYNEINTQIPKYENLRILTKSANYADSYGNTLWKLLTNTKTFP